MPGFISISKPPRSVWKMVFPPTYGFSLEEAGKECILGYEFYFKGTEVLGGGREGGKWNPDESYPEGTASKVTPQFQEMGEMMRGTL